MLYCPNFFWNVLQVWMTGKDVYLQMTWSWPDKTWNILCSYCLQWNTSQSKFRNHYFLFLFAFSILSQLFLIWGCSFNRKRFCNTINNFIISSFMFDLISCHIFIGWSVNVDRSSKHTVQWSCCIIGYLWSQDRDNGHLWTSLTVRHRSTD